MLIEALRPSLDTELGEYPALQYFVLYLYLCICVFVFVTGALNIVQLMQLSATWTQLTSPMLIEASRPSLN